MYDSLFLAGGTAAICVSAIVAWLAIRARHPLRLLVALLWACFGAGFVTQARAPNLKIENGRFVVPERDSAGAAISDPIGLVGIERRMQLWSGLLTGLSAVGLAAYYLRRSSGRSRLRAQTDMERRVA
jgi:hypothetical protein